MCVGIGCHDGGLNTFHFVWCRQHYWVVCSQIRGHLTYRWTLKARLVIYITKELVITSFKYLFTTEIDKDTWLCKHRNAGFIVFILIHDRNKLGLVCIGINLLRHNGALYSHTTLTSIGFLSIFLGADKEYLLHLGIGHHLFHELILVLTILQIPNIYDDVNPIGWQAFRQLLHSYLILFWMPAIWYEYLRVLHCLLILCASRLNCYSILLGT